MKSKQERQDNATKLIEARSKRTPKQQWDMLNRKLGYAQGARKARRRLLQQMDAATCLKCEGYGCEECSYLGYVLPEMMS